MESATTSKPNLPAALFAKQGMNDEEFDRTVLSKLQEANVRYSYITSPKSWAVASNVMTMFEREYVPHNTFINIKGAVYQLTQHITLNDFRKVGKLQGMIKFQVTPEHFAAISCWDDLSEATRAYVSSYDEEQLDYLEKEELSAKIFRASDRTNPEDEPFIPFIGDGEKLQQVLRTPESVRSALPENLQGKVSTAQYPEPLIPAALDLSSGEGFNRFLENRFERVRDTMGVKGEEYRKGGDVFHNFNRAAQMNRQIPEEALWGFASKQIISTIDLIEDIKQGRLPSSALVSEKCSDLVNYVLLLEAMILKRIADQAGKHLVG